MSLNPSQEEAVHTTDGRLLILAGAGSGKTRVLTMRIAHLIKKKAVSPKAILGLTFTNKAAAEMRERLLKEVGALHAKQVSLLTFHSFCLKILRKEIHRLGYTEEFSLYDAHDVQRLVNLIARDLLEREADLPSLSHAVQAIAKAKNKGLKPEEIEGTGSSWHDEFTRTVYARLQDSLRAYNAVDFDHMLSLSVELFEKCPDILNEYQEQYRYIMIDEYQDTNPIQCRLAELLASKYRNLCVVGDDDQSIYGWRGANVQNILTFEHDKMIKLEQNYRSNNTILKAANSVISLNKDRRLKSLWSSKGMGHKIELFFAPNEVSEAEAVVCRMLKMKESLNAKWKDFAILYRSNALSRAFEFALMKQAWQDRGQFVRGIPFQIFGGTEFYERREIKDLQAYLRLISNPKDQEALLRIINQPRRGIGESSLDQLTAYNRSQDVPLWEVLKQVVDDESFKSKFQISAKTANGIFHFVETIEEAKKRFLQEPLHDSLKWLIEKINYKRAIDEEVKSEQMRSFKWENVQEFVQVLKEYEASEVKDEPSLHHFVSIIALQEEWKKSSSKSFEEDKVSLMTFHSAKGLEFPFCFLVGVEDHIIPHEKSLKETGVEEERRLFYVAITRAMHRLVIAMATKRKQKGQEISSSPSRFLFDIPKDLLNLTKWDQIN
ncbi:MAG TPA: UvrD-helicase domain-containing protein [Parachlamydiaceae bacterium]|nr:UvrD-helicase domain-containing protein [Parachlamydiaceae bacterium]